MSEIVFILRPSNKADASFRFGVTMSAIGRSSSLHAGTRNLHIFQQLSAVSEAICDWDYLSDWKKEKNNNNDKLCPRNKHEAEP